MGGSSSGPSFAVAFGGGGARGLAHIHVVETLDELGIRPVAIAGSSIGAVIGAAVAAGMSGSAIRDYAGTVLGSTAEVAARMWRTRPESISSLFGNGLRVGQFDIEGVLKAFLPDDLPASFEQLEIPLQVTGTDFFAHEEIVFSEGELLPALAASAAVPGVFRPVNRSGRILIDGGIANPVPFDLLRDKADILIAIDVVGVPRQNGAKEPGTIDLLLGSSQIMMQSITALKLRQVRPDILLRPPVSRFKILDFMKIEQVLAETAPIRDELKFAIEAAVGRFCEA